MLTRLLLLPVLPCLLACTAWAETAGHPAGDADPRNRVSFQVDRDRAVENDRVTATLRVTDEDGSAAALAERINQTMTWALAKARNTDGIEVRSGGYQTFPVTHEGKIRRWRASQELILESGSVDELTDLVGTLQEKLALAGLAFSVSAERRRGVEDELIDAALAAFLARAERIAKTLGAQGFEIVQIGIGGGGRPTPVVQRSMAMAESVRTAPAVEAGTSRVGVNVHGTIELRGRP